MFEREPINLDYSAYSRVERDSPIFSSKPYEYMNVITEEFHGRFQDLQHFHATLDGLAQEVSMPEWFYYGAGLGFDLFSSELDRLKVAAVHVNSAAIATRNTKITQQGSRQIDLRWLSSRVGVEPLNWLDRKFNGSDNSFNSTMYGFVFSSATISFAREGIDPSKILQTP